MESQPQNPEFRINPENFHPCNHEIGEYIHKFSSKNKINHKGPVQCLQYATK